MKTSLLLLSILHRPVVSFFASYTQTLAVRCTSSLNVLPTVEEVANDDFMKQLGHTAELIPLIHSKSPQVPTSDLLKLLSTQFSHSEGIRGFFAVYLTSPESQNEESVPDVLAQAVKGADDDIMVPLACMNVVMPTAMAIIHQDQELKECASKTAENGKKILRLLKGQQLVMDNCMAIDRVCAELEGDDELFKYWDNFFRNYKYGPDEKESIGLAVAEFC